MRDAIRLAGVVTLAALTGTAVGGIGGGGGDVVLVLADSAADFQGDQAENGWFYGYYDGDAGDESWTPADFELMNVYDDAMDRWWVDNSPDGPLTLIDKVYMHPNGPLGEGGRNEDMQWSVRRWVSSVDALVNIHVDMARGNQEFGGDGVKLRVFVDGVQSLIVDLFPDNDAGVAIDLAAVVSAGSTIDFAIDPVDDALFDAVEFSAVITTIIPGPGVLAGLGLAGLVTGRRRRR